MKDKNAIVPSESNAKVSVLDKVYGLALNGIPHLDKPLVVTVNSYLSKTKSRDKAIDEYVRNQKIKCGTTGFITGLGGLLSLPLTIPADLASSLYIELRMIAGIALIRGYNIYDDQVKTAVYLCLVGNALGDVVKQAGIKIGEKLVIKKLLPRLTREVTTKINQRVAFKLITKNGTKGVINVGKMIPLIGGIIGGGWNVIEVGTFAKYAKRMFNENR